MFANPVLTKRSPRSTAAWRVSWVCIALAVAFQTTSCAASTVVGQPTTGQPTSGPGTTITTPVVDWNPQHLTTTQATISQGAATIHVGERLQFTASDADPVYFRVEPTDLNSITWYGDAFTFLGIKPGTAKLTIPNYNKHFDCPNGPCAHPNEPLTLVVTVLAATAGSKPAPAISAPIVLTAANTKTDSTLHLRVGQRVQIPSDLRPIVGGTDSAVTNAPGVGELGEIDSVDAGLVTLVGAKPGTLVVGLTSTTAAKGYVSLTVLIGS